MKKKPPPLKRLLTPEHSLRALSPGLGLKAKPKPNDTRKKKHSPWPPWLAYVVDALVILGSVLAYMVLLSPMSSLQGLSLSAKINLEGSTIYSLLGAPWLLFGLCTMVLGYGLSFRYLAGVTMGEFLLRRLR